MELKLFTLQLPAIQCPSCQKTYSILTDCPAAFNKVQVPVVNLFSVYANDVLTCPFCGAKEQVEKEDP